MLGGAIVERAQVEPSEQRLALAEHHRRQRQMDLVDVASATADVEAPFLVGDAKTTSTSALGTSFHETSNGAFRSTTKDHLEP